MANASHGRLNLGDKARLTIFLLSAAQIATPPLLFANGFEEQASASGSLRGETPVVPADYAFVIWGFIFGASLIWAGWHLFSKDGGGPIFRRIAPAVGGTFLLCILWLAAARFGPLAITAPIFALMLLLLATALNVAARSASEMKPLEERLTFALLGSYAGWSTVAVFANLTEVLAELEFKFFGMTPEKWAAMMIVIATLIACALARVSRGSIAYAAAVLWALVGIALANSKPAEPLILLPIAAGALLLLAYTLVKRSRA